MLVDTSALYNLLDTEASHHAEAANVFEEMLDHEDSLVTPQLVHRVSFELMRAERIDRAFAFDADFARQGFATVP